MILFFTRVLMTIIPFNILLLFGADHRPIPMQSSKQQAAPMKHTYATAVPLLQTIHELDEAANIDESSSSLDLLEAQSKHLPKLLESYLNQEITGLTTEHLDELLTSADYFALDAQQTDHLIATAANQDLKALLHVYKKRCDRRDGSEKCIKDHLEKISPFTPTHKIEHRHKRIVSLVQLDVQHLLSVGADHTAVIFKAISDDEWQAIAQLGTPYNDDPANGHVRSLTHALSFDENTVITASYDCTCVVWQKNAHDKWALSQRLGTVDNSQIGSNGHSNAVMSIARIDDNSFVSTSFDHTAIIWQKDADDNWYLKQRLGDEDNRDDLQGHIAQVTCAAALNDTTVVTVSADCTALIWHKNDDTWEIEQQLGLPANHNARFGHTAGLSSIAVLDDSTIITGSYDRTMLVWKKQHNALWHLEKRIGSVDVSKTDSGHAHEIIGLSKLNEHSFMSCAAHESAIIWQRNKQHKWHINQRVAACAEVDEIMTDKDITSAVKINDTTIATVHKHAQLLVWKRNIEELIKIIEH